MRQVWRVHDGMQYNEDGAVARRRISAAQTPPPGQQDTGVGFATTPEQQCIWFYEKATRNKQWISPLF